MTRSFSRTMGRAAALAIALGGMALVGPSVAGAVVPACGATVTHNVTLTGNMDCSSSTIMGINVGESGITINLNGHTISSHDRSSTSGHWGIFNSRHNNVTVENGTVHGYVYGVYDQVTDGSKILHVKTTGDVYGINVFYSRNGLIDHSTASGSRLDGISLNENENVNVANSIADHNGEYGIFDYRSHSTLDGVTANSNGGDGVYIDSHRELQYSSLGRYTVRNSTADSNNASGFYIVNNYGPARQADLIGNTASDNHDWGFYAQHWGTDGSANRATGNGRNYWQMYPWVFQPSGR